MVSWKVLSLKITNDGTFLVVQGLRTLLPMWVKPQVQSLIREDSTCQRATKLMNHNYRAQLELVLYNKRSHCNEKPPLIATRESLHVEMKTQHSQK